MGDPAFPTGYERVLPPNVLRVVRARRRELLGRAGGRVLDLGGCEAHLSALVNATSVVVLETPEELGERLVRRAAQAAVPAEVRSASVLELDRGETFDTIVSVLQITRDPRPSTILHHLASLLDQHGRLLLLEPTTGVGVLGDLQRMADPLVRVAFGRHIDSDLPKLVRDEGLRLDGCERVSVRALWPTWSFVSIDARHAPVPAASDRS